MDFFQFSRYQVALSAEFAAAEELATAHHFLAGWPHQHAYLAADQELRPELCLVEDLDLDTLGRLEMVVDVETYDTFVFWTSNPSKNVAAKSPPTQVFGGFGGGAGLVQYSVYSWRVDIHKISE